MKPRFFAKPSDFRAWLAKYHLSASELVVGFYRKGTGRASITWPESVDEALCFGWIDGIRRRLDETSYRIRFTPRRRGSTWSAINIARVAELTKRGRMRAAGLAAFRRRTDDKSSIYAYEQRRNATLTPAQRRSFRANKRAWAFFQAQAPSYQRTVSYWMISARKEETRGRRLARLIEYSARGRRL